MSGIRNLEWGRLGIEGIAIVLSILLAFWIDAWWEDRVEQADLVAQLQAFDTELSNNTDNLRGQITNLSNSLLALNRVFEYLADTSSEELPESFYSDLGRSLWFYASPIDTSVYQEILGSGALQRIQNSQLSAAVGDYARVVRDLDAHVIELYASYRQIVIPALSRHVALSELGWWEYESFTGPDGEIDATPPDAPFSMDESGLRSPDVWNALYHWKGSQIDSMIFMDELGSSMNKLRNLLRDELGELDQ